MPWAWAMDVGMSYSVRVFVGFWKRIGDEAEIQSAMFHKSVDTYRVSRI